MSVKLSTAANAAALALCGAMLVLGASAVVLRLDRPKQLAVENVEDRPAAPYPPGSQLPVRRAVTGDVRRTVILVLGTECHFCTASIPFYKRLMGLAEVDGTRGRVVIVSVSKVDDMVTYLSAHSLKYHSVIGLRESDLRKIRITPSVVVVDADGTVKGSWAGVLTPQSEEAVMASLRDGSS